MIAVDDLVRLSHRLLALCMSPGVSYSFIEDKENPASFERVRMYEQITAPSKNLGDPIEDESSLENQPY